MRVVSGNSAFSSRDKGLMSMEPIRRRVSLKRNDPFDAPILDALGAAEDRGENVAQYLKYLILAGIEAVQSKEAGSIKNPFALRAAEGFEPTETRRGRPRGVSEKRTQGGQGVPTQHGAVTAPPEKAPVLPPPQQPQPPDVDPAIKEAMGNLFGTKRKAP
jgi:hypothetical protein